MSSYIALALAPPPPGVTPNFVNPESRGQQYVITSTICLALMISLLLLRLYSKHFISHTLSVDDLVCVVAAAGSIAFAAVTLDALHHGLGVHQWNVLITPIFLKEQHVLAIIYEPTTYLTKLSLLLVYHRLFSIHRTTRYLIYLGIAANTIFYFIMMLLFVFLKTVAAGRILSIVLGGVNVLSDFYIFCIPISAVSRLQMPLRRKIGVMTVFFTGFLACVASILSCVYRIQIGQGGDITWTEVPAFIALTVEVNVGIMCSCMVYLPSLVQHKNSPLLGFPFIRSLRSRLLGSSSRSKPRSKQFFGNKATSSSHRRSEGSEQKHSSGSYMELGDVQAARVYMEGADDASRADAVSRSSKQDSTKVSSIV